jgi:hypothetical protein
MNSPIPKDKDLYEKIKKEITEKYKPSAYRSGLLVKKYKQEYLKKYKSNDAYEGSKPIMSNLKRWFLEDWRNQRGEIGYKKEGDIYRPTKRINKKTPKTINELSLNDIKKAQKEKKQKGRVKKF